MLKELYFGQITFRVSILNIQVEEVSRRELEVLLRGVVKRDREVTAGFGHW